jgi:mono/diheme cytochrome c family protein
MNKEIGYIGQGALLMIVLIMGIGIVQFALSVKPAPALADAKPTSGKQFVAYNQKGKALFQNNCATCHAIHKDMTGPGLADVEQRVPDKKLLYNWVRNNQAVLASGNKYFNRLYILYNKTPMNVFPALTDEDIAAIFEYVRQASAYQPLPAAVAAL